MGRLCSFECRGIFDGGRIGKRSFNKAFKKEADEKRGPKWWILKCLLLAIKHKFDSGDESHEVVPLPLRRLYDSRNTSVNPAP